MAMCERQSKIKIKNYYQRKNRKYINNFRRCHQLHDQERKFDPYLVFLMVFLE